MTRSIPPGLPMERICVVMTSAIGNAVHVLPVLNALKRAHPHARVSWIMNPGLATLVRGHPSVDEIIPFERRRGWRGFLALRRVLSGRRFDLVLAFQSYLKAGFVTALVPARVKLGFDRARASDLNWLFTTHRIESRPVALTGEMYLEFLDALGVPRGEVAWDLGPRGAELERQRSFFEPLERPVAALVVGASKAERNWTPAGWAALADALHLRHGLQPVLVGGRSEHEREVERVIRARSAAPVISTLGAPLREMVGVLDGSALVVSVDTGPLHLAVALGRPVVSLMGYENPKRTGPFRPELHDLVVDAYGDLGERYPASFELRPGRTRRIEVEQVMERVDRALRRYPPSLPSLDPERG